MKASLSLNGYMLIDDKKATAEQINAIIAERDSALAQNADLVAQVEAEFNKARQRAERFGIDYEEPKLVCSLPENLIRLQPIYGSC